VRQFEFGRSRNLNGRIFSAMGVGAPGARVDRPGARRSRWLKGANLQASGDRPTDYRAASRKVPLARSVKAPEKRSLPPYLARPVSACRRDLHTRDLEPEGHRQPHARYVRLRAGADQLHQRDMGQRKRSERKTIYDVWLLQSVVHGVHQWASEEKRCCFGSAQSLRVSLCGRRPRLS
jgi:hypothetical protein